MIYFDIFICLFVSGRMVGCLVYNKTKKMRNEVVLAWYDLPRGSSENHETLSHNSRSPQKGFKPGPAQHEAGQPTTRPGRSIYILYGCWHSKRDNIKVANISTEAAQLNTNFISYRILQTVPLINLFHSGFQTRHCIYIIVWIYL